MVEASTSLQKKPLSSRQHPALKLISKFLTTYVFMFIHISKNLTVLSFVKFQIHILSIVHWLNFGCGVGWGRERNTDFTWSSFIFGCKGALSTNISITYDEVFLYNTKSCSYITRNRVFSYIQHDRCLLTSRK